MTSTENWTILAACCAFLMTSVFADTGQCIWYGYCNLDDRGFHQPCQYSGPPKNFTYPNAMEILQKNCPELLNENGEAVTCCDGDQVLDMQINLLKASGVYSRCPSCIRNMYKLFCSFTCSVKQSEFMEIAESKTNENGKYVKALNVYLKEDFMEQIYDSCKGVVMPQSGKYATDIACGAYNSASCNWRRWFDYMGVNNPFSPFDIYFESNTGLFEDMTSFETEITRCNESYNALTGACSCVDCPLSCPATDNSIYAPPAPTYFSVLGIDIYVLCAILLYLSTLCLTGFLIRRHVKQRRSKVLPNSDRIALTDRVQKNPSKFEEWGYKWEVLLEVAFNRLGIACASQPMLVLFIASWVLGALIYGAPDIELISSPVKLWAAPESQSRLEKDYFDSRFGPFYRSQQIFIKAVGLPEFQHEMLQGNVTFGPIFSREFLLKVRELQMAIENLASEDGITLDKVCYAPIHNEFTGPIAIESCTIITIWGYFQNSLEKFNLEGEKSGLKTNYLNVIYDCLQNAYDPSCLAPYGGPSENLLVLGGLRDDNMDNMTQADSLVLNFVLKNHVNETENEPALGWEKKLIDYLLNWEKKEKPEWMDMAFMAERSIEDEIQRVAETSAGIVVISYVIMVVYVSVALGRISSWRRVWVDCKVVVALASVSSVGLSVLAAMGIFAYSNYPSILLTLEAVPFLVLAVGVDNLFIMVRWHDRLLDDEGKPKPSAARLGDVLKHAGPSMLLSTLAEEGCFLIGALSPMPAVKSFALLAATALGINFFLQITVQVAVLALDERRRLDGRADVLCCLRPTPPSAPNRGRQVQRFFEHVLAPTLMNRWVRVAVPLAFFFMLLAACTMMPRVEVGLDQSLAMTKDSYVYKYFEFMKELLSIGPPVYFVVTKGLDYSNRTHQNLICGAIGCRSDSLAGVIQSASKSPKLTHMARPASNWLDDLFDWTTLESCCKEFASNNSFCPHDRTEPECRNCVIELDNSGSRPSPAALRKYVPNFLRDIPDANCAKGGQAAYADGVNYVLDQYGMADVGDSFFMAYHTPVRTPPDYYEALRAARKMANKVQDTINSELQLDEEVRVFPYSVFYVYFEQYLTAIPDTAVLLTYSLCVLFVITTVLNGLDLIASLMVSAIVIMILVEMIAVMYLWDITLNAVSMVNLVVAMGIAVEFNSHVMHAFQKSTKEDRKARAFDALVNTGSSVFSGIFLTKLSGIAVLAFAPVQILVVFYFRMYATMVILGALHGLVLLPVLLSFIGPRVNRARYREVERRRVARDPRLLSRHSETTSA